MCTTIDDHGRVCLEVTREDGSHCTIAMCDVCDGRGYLLDQEYGYADAPPDWRYVQRCDTCERYAGDDDAAQAAVNDGHGVAAAYWFAAPPDDEHEDIKAPGDYAIRVCQ